MGEKDAPSKLVLQLDSQDAAQTLIRMGKSNEQLRFKPSQGPCRRFDATLVYQIRQLQLEGLSLSWQDGTLIATYQGRSGRYPIGKHMADLTATRPGQVLHMDPATVWSAVEMAIMQYPITLAPQGPRQHQRRDAGGAAPAPRPPPAATGTAAGGAGTSSAGSLPPPPSTGVQAAQAAQAHERAALLARVSEAAGRANLLTTPASKTASQQAWKQPPARGDAPWAGAVAGTAVEPTAGGQQMRDASDVRLPPSDESDEDMGFEEDEGLEHDDFQLVKGKKGGRGWAKKGAAAATENKLSQKARDLLAGKPAGVAKVAKAPPVA